jgi:flavin reductase (DIM6/NTAB) family NADH-FMN oxidoreductase RutF
MQEPSPPTAADRALRQQFLHGMSFAASTVNVVTTDGVAGRHGVTVSAMVSVSADTPQPTLLVCIHHLSPVVAAVLKNGVFCVNVLRDDQAHISDNFAGRSGAHGTAKFDCTTWATQTTGAPRVVDALVAFDCRVTASERVGSHFVVFGSVQDIFVSGVGAPLIYANRAYGVPRRFRPRRAARRSAAAGTLAIGCDQMLAPYILPALVARLTKLHPEISLTLIEADHEHLLTSLRRNDTEIALLHDAGLGEDLQVESLAELTPYVLLPDGHPLTAAPGVTLQDLIREPLVLLDIEPIRNYTVSLFRAFGLEPLISHRSRSLEMVRGLVGHGLGYSLLATKPANNITYDGRALVARPLANAIKHNRLAMAALESRALSPLAVEFAEHCRSLFRVSQSHFAPGHSQS